ncbi:hypothetical protein [Candidatus Parabeggiatoa sp. HSG14]|uniref:hypothetical protein n=1 Tax=Candidatus Parabeggiatoa sp. HSG14 TaxID=3055593 RepID=UPI0025A7FAC9|nr:hypothetical protein [Thiotrichales bacterium HSG14]
MKKQIKFSYELVGTGWSKCVLETDKGSVTTTASYLDDALGNLCKALYEIICGKEYSQAIFTEEPGEYRWVFKKINNDSMKLQILEYDDLWLGLPDEDGKLIYEDKFKIKRFVQAFIRGINRLLTDVTQIASKLECKIYFANWNAKFLIITNFGDTP